MQYKFGIIYEVAIKMSYFYQMTKKTLTDKYFLKR